MNRKYTREEYLDKIKMLQEELPGCSITTDIICGFCDETEKDHQETLDVMSSVPFDSSFTFIYSERSGTFAEKNLHDNIPLTTKHRRLEEVIALQKRLSEQQNDKYLGSDVEILVEGPSKRDKREFFGRTDTNKVVIFNNTNKQIHPGDFITLHIMKITSATLFGVSV
jgi:tRNA-2-methylthio-N6-dimethylallyladenosine synthase